MGAEQKSRGTTLRERSATRYKIGNREAYTWVLCELWYLAFLLFSVCYFPLAVYHLTHWG